MERRRNLSIIAAAAKAIRAKRARLHFRAAVRLACENHYWLEDTEGEQLGMNVAKNIQILTRKKPKGQFSLLEKAMMKVPQEKRTEPEKQHLRRVLGSLKFFRKYPSEVKKELAMITYFAEYGPDRVVVRQGDEAMALYFVISGTARVLCTKYDILTGKMVPLSVKVKEAGDIFGELALLLGAKRSATIITNERSEFLIVKREDFDRVLKDTVLKEWNEIKKSMGKFEYFKQWSDRYIQQSCMVSKMRYYDENALILSGDYGDRRYVYFLIDGTVDLLECVEMRVISFRNQKSYTLFNPLETSAMMRKRKSLTVDLAKFNRARSNSKSFSDDKFRSRLLSRNSINSAELNAYASRSLIKLQSLDYVDEEDEPKKTRRRPKRKVAYKDELSDMTPAQRIKFVKNYESRLSRVHCLKELPAQMLETHFIRVATMNQLATFNIGEHLNSRFYVARTKVKLLAIPQYWLFSRDKPTWNNITIFLRTRLPSRQQLFDEFGKRKKWEAYKKQCYFDIADKTQKPNTNSINNVPISLRLNEDLDFFISQKPLPMPRRRSSFL